jgi:hypothetical protein
MTIAALVLTVITAGAALWTVRLSYRAIRLAKQATESSEESAKTGKRAAEAGERAADAANATAAAASRTAEEVRLGRERDRLEWQRERIHALIGLIEELQALQRSVTEVSDLRWITKRNLLVAKIAGLEDVLPKTIAVTQATSPANARFQDARIELDNSLREIERDIYVHDLAK